MQRKLKNTMAFGPGAQNEDMMTGETFGLMGSSGQASGLLRGAAAKKDQKIVQMSNLNKELIQDKRNAKQLQTASVALPGQGRKKNKREKKKGGKKQFGQQAL